MTGMSYTQLTGEYLDGEGNALSGTATFTVNVALSAASGVAVLQPAVPVQASITGGQLQSLTGGIFQLADMASAVSIEGSLTSFWFWTVQETLARQALEPWSFFLEHSATPVDLHSLADGGIPGSFLPVPSGSPSPGDVPVVTVASPLALDWGTGGTGGGGSGTVTSVSVASANGLAGSVTSPETTPAITLSTTATGLLKGNGTAISAATAGTDYLAPGGSGAGLTGITAAQAGADASGSAGMVATALTAEATRATGAEGTISAAVTAEATRAGAAEALLAPKANPTFTGTVTVPATAGATDAAQKAYVDSVASGLDAKPSVTVTATSSLTLAGTQTADGIAVTAGSRVLCTGQSTASQNGLWVAASGAWTRPADFASGSVQSGAFAFTEAGTANGSSGWVLTGAAPVTVDTSAQTWTQFSGAGEVNAGPGLGKSGNTISLTATLDQVPTAAAGVALGGHKVTGLANGSAGTDAAAFGQVPVSAATIGGLLAASNLSDLPSTPTARTNLGLGSAATQAMTAFDAAGLASTAQANAQAASIPVTGGTATGPVAATVLSATGLTGATAASRYAGATTTSFPQSGTWTAGDWTVDQAGAIWMYGSSARWMRWGDAPHQFRPESYGAKGDMAIGHDLAITSGQPTLTTAGVANPSSAPTLATATTGGTVAAGTYQVVVTYVSATGETVASSSASITTTGSTSTITVTTPAANGVPGGAIGWNAYFTAAGGSTFFKQDVTASPWPFPNNFILTAPPNVSNPQPPGANTTTSSPWAGMKAGQAIRVIGAGAGGADLRTTIASVGGSSATLNANAGTTVTASGAVWGTDDTSAVQQAINAAAAYFAASNRTGEVLLSKLYLSNTAPVVGGAYAGNCVLQLPSVANGAPKVRVSIIGVSKDVSTLPVYQQMVPEMSGTGVIYIGPNGTNDATYGPAHVIGTPTLPAIYVTESGNTPGTTNIKVMMDSVRVIVPFAGGIGGIDLFSAAQSANYNCSVQALGIVPSGGSWTRILANGPTTSQWGWGLREPGAGNNAQSYTEQFCCEGLCYGYGPSEHLVAVDIFVAYCVNGFQAYSGNGISMVHNAHILSGGAEFCSNALGAFDGGIKIDIDNFRTESVGKQVLDPSNRLQGTIGLRCQGTTGQYSAGFINAGTVTGMRIVNMMTTPGPLASPQAAPATTVAWPNYYYRDAFIEVALSGGTFSAFTVDAVSKPAAVGAAAYAFMLPAGHSYTPTYSAGTLTHAVTLL